MVYLHWSEPRLGQGHNGMKLSASFHITFEWGQRLIPVVVRCFGPCSCINPGSSQCEYTITGAKEVVNSVNRMQTINCKTVMAELHFQFWFLPQCIPMKGKSTERESERRKYWPFLKSLWESESECYLESESQCKSAIALSPQEWRIQKHSCDSKRAKLLKYFIQEKSQSSVASFIRRLMMHTI